MSRSLDRSGERIGILTIEKPCGKTPQGRIIWKMRCDCGNIIERTFKATENQSCGCLARKITSIRSKTHGMSRSNNKTYKVWVQMRRRCRERDGYADRGITVCEHWKSFENFLADMGERPKGMTLERKDVNGNYDPDNCEWANAKTQANNRRNNVRITHCGVSHTASEWSKITGIRAQTIRWRLKQGWSIEKALVL